MNLFWLFLYGLAEKEEAAKKSNADAIFQALLEEEENEKKKKEAVAKKKAKKKAKKAAAAEPPSDPRVRVLRVLVVPAVSDALRRAASGSGQGNVGD